MGIRFQSDGLDGGQWVDDATYDNYGSPMGPPAPRNTDYDGWTHGSDFSQGMNQFNAPDGNKYIYSASKYMNGPKLFSYDGRPVPPEVLEMVRKQVPNVQIGSDEFMRRNLLDPDAPGGGNEGGSNLANLGTLASFIFGGSSLAGALGASGQTAAQSLGGLWNGAGAGADALNSFDTGAMQNALEGGGGSWAGGVPDQTWGVNPQGGSMDLPAMDDWNYGGTDPGYQDPFAGTEDYTYGTGDSGNIDINGQPMGDGTTGSPGLLDFIKKNGMAAAKALGLTGGNTGTGTGSSDLARILGGIGSAGLGAYASNQQRQSLETLAREQMAAEQGRYTDQRGINQARYGDALTRADAATARGIEAQTFGRGIGAPSRDRYEGSYAPGFTMANDPGYQDALNQASKATLHGLSVAGNPAGSPNAWAQSLKDNYEKTAYPALQQYRSNNATTGGFAGYNASGASAPGYNAAAGGGVGFGNPGAGANESAAAIGANANIFGSIGKGLANVTNPPDNSLAEFMKRYYGGGNKAFEVA